VLVTRTDNKQILTLYVNVMARRRYLAWCILWRTGDSVNNDLFWATVLQTRSYGIEYARNNRVIVGNGVFLRGPCRDFIRKGQSQLLGTFLKALPCGGGVEYLHRDPASRRRRRKGKSQIWDSKIWPRVLRDSDPKMTALARASGHFKQQTCPLVREGAPNQQTRNCQTIIKIWS
jgi:hypothetical protein